MRDAGNYIARRPEATDVSALDHILGGQQTMPTDKGLILEETWRAPLREASSARRAGLMGKPRSRVKEQRRYLEVSML